VQILQKIIPLQKKNNMKANYFHNGLAMFIIALVFSSCGVTTTLESWKSPEIKTGISKVVVMPLFNKIEYAKPFEQAMCSYFNAKGLKSIGSLEFLNPDIKYSIADIKRKCDSLSADAILVFDYQGTDKTQQYVPETTYVTGGFGGYWGGGYYGGYGVGSGGYYGVSTVTTGGYWSTTSIVNLKASLYTHASKSAVWTGEITVTDPKYVDQASDAIARRIYSDWQSQYMLRNSSNTK
jgi:hypothetical protein